MRRSLSFCSFLVLSLGLLHSPLLHATNYLVNTTEDISDNTPDGVCDDGLGKCSLREAIQESNFNPGPDTITFAGCGTPECVYLLTLGGIDEDGAATGDLDVNGDLTITGQGPAVTIVDGNQLDRVFDLDPGQTGAAITLSSLTVRNGNAQLGKFFNSGGGILASGSVDSVFTLDNLVVTQNNSIIDGGGISVFLGTFALNNSTVSDNDAQGGNGGGGIFFGNGVNTIEGSTIENNRAGRGGGIELLSQLTINNSTIRDNHAINRENLGHLGGGILSQGTLAVNNTTISGNSTIESGGGISSFGPVTITSSTISDNTATENGGGLSPSQETVSVTNSTISGNTAGQAGGGIFINPPPQNLVIKNGFNPPDITLLHLTIAGNSAATGSGIANEGVAEFFNFHNSIIASNEGDNCSGPGLSLGGNVSDDATCNLTGTGDKPNANPALGPLADNGGPTQTQDLLAGSEAIDAGVDCPPPNTDQRGVQRPQGVSCDSGAVEVQCGDGKVDGNEECDDGNNLDSDGCSSVCLLETSGAPRFISGSGCSLGNAGNATPWWTAGVALFAIAIALRPRRG